MRRIAIACAVVSSAALAQTETRTVAGSDVAIYNLAGRVRAVAGSGSDVSVEITRRGPDASRLRIETSRVRGRDALVVVYPSDRIVYRDLRNSRTELSVHDDGTFGDGSWGDWRSRDRVIIRGSGDGLEAQADLVVSVPKGQRIALYLGAGRLDVVNVAGDVLVDVAAADVDVSGVRGPLSLDTGSGHVSVRDVAGEVTVETGSGSVSVSQVKGRMLDLDTGSGTLDATDIDVGEFVADVGSGGIRVARLKAPTVRVENGSGSTSIELLSDVDLLEVESGSGSLTLRVPATLSAEIDAETGSGGFQTDFELLTRRLGRNHVEGRIGAGKGRIRLESGSGTIRLLKL